MSLSFQAENNDVPFIEDEEKFENLQVFAFQAQNQIVRQKNKINVKKITKYNKYHKKIEKSSFEYYFAYFQGLYQGKKQGLNSKQEANIKKKSLSINEEMFREIIKILGISEAESLEKLIIKVKKVENESDIEGNGRNATRILGHFIIKFMKDISKKLPTSEYILKILTKPSKKFMELEETKAENLLWRQKLKFEEFFKWVKDINLKQKITSLKTFQQIFSFTLVSESSFKCKHFSVVLKRIIKHVLLNEFTKYLFLNSINKKNKQNWKNAIQYISKIPKFLKAIKEPILLYNK